MIQIVFSVKPNNSTKLVNQVAAMQAAPLDQGELTPLRLTVAGDVTAYNPGAERIERTYQLNETPEFVTLMGGTTPPGPTSIADDARKGAVKGMFQLKLSQRLTTPVDEEITLL